MSIASDTRIYCVMRYTQEGTARPEKRSRYGTRIHAGRRPFSSSGTPSRSSLPSLQCELSAFDQGDRAATRTSFVHCASIVQDVISTRRSVRHRCAAGLLARDTSRAPNVPSPVTTAPCNLVSRADGEASIEPTREQC